MTQENISNEKRIETIEKNIYKLKQYLIEAMKVIGKIRKKCRYYDFTMKPESVKQEFDSLTSEVEQYVANALKRI